MFCLCSNHDCSCSRRRPADPWRGIRWELYTLWTRYPSITEQHSWWDLNCTVAYLCLFTPKHWTNISPMELELSVLYWNVHHHLIHKCIGTCCIQVPLTQLIQNCSTINSGNFQNYATWWCILCIQLFFFSSDQRSKSMQERLALIPTMSPSCCGWQGRASSPLCLLSGSLGK